MDDITTWVRVPSVVREVNGPYGIERRIVDRGPAELVTGTLSKTPGGTFPAWLSDLVAGREMHIGDLIDVPPFRLRVVDYDTTMRRFLVVPARVGWRRWVWRIRFSNAYRRVRQNVALTLWIWGLRDAPKGDW